MILVESGRLGDLVVSDKSRRSWDGRQQREQVLRSVADSVGANLVEDAIALDLSSSRSIRIARRRIIDRIDGCYGTEIASSKWSNRYRFVARSVQVIPHPLVVSEEKQFIFNHWATHAAAKLIPAIAGHAA